MRGAQTHGPALPEQRAARAGGPDPRLTHRRDGSVHSRGRLLSGQRPAHHRTRWRELGLIQHHFGDRDGLLTAAEEDAVDRRIRIA